MLTLVVDLSQCLHEGQAETIQDEEVKGKSISQI